MSKVEFLWAPFKKSMRLQLVAMVGFVLLLAIVVVVSFVTLRSTKATEKKALQSVSQVAATLGRVSGYYIRFKQEELQTMADNVASDNPDLVYLEFRSAKGNVLAHFSRDDQSKIDLPKMFPSTDKNPPTVTNWGGQPMAWVAYPIMGEALSVQTDNSDELDLMGLDEMASTPASGAQLVGDIRLVLSLKATKDEVSRSALWALVLSLLVLFCAVVLVDLLGRRFLAPVAEVAQDANLLATGDLSQESPEITRQDELGALKKAFVGMVKTLKSTLFRVGKSSLEVSKTSSSLKKKLSQTRDLTHEERKATEAVVSRVQEMLQGVEKISQSMQALSTRAEEASASVMEMGANIQEVAGTASSLQGEVAQGAGTLEENSRALEAIETSVTNLRRLVEETSSGVVEMDSSIREVERNAEEAADLTSEVGRQASSGGERVEHTLNSIELTRERFREIQDAVRRLGKRSSNIQAIVEVIEEVTEQTNLLALNAAIIAAQAGEHGKSFSVVADEIRLLAGKTAESTQEIISIVEGLHSEVVTTTEAVGAGNAMMDQSVKAATEAAEALRSILGITEPAAQRVTEIARATAEQSRGAQDIVRAIDEVTTMTEQIANATTEQGKGTEHLLAIIQNVKDAAQELTRATDEQNAGTTVIAEATSELSRSVNQVAGTARDHGSQGKQALDALARFRQVVSENLSLLEESLSEIEHLATSSEDLKKELKHFKVAH